MLMIAKSFAWLFLVLSVLNLPVFLFYYQGNMVRNNFNNANRSPFSFQQIFAEFSLGNIGQSQVACGHSNLAIEKDVGVSCAYGHVSDVIQMAGFTVASDTICSSLTDSWSETDDLPNSLLSPTCQLNKNLFKSKAVQTQFAADFKAKCNGLIECSLSLASLRTMLSDECLKDLDKRVKASKYFRENSS